MNKLLKYAEFTRGQWDFQVYWYFVDGKYFFMKTRHYNWKVCWETLPDMDQWKADCTWEIFTKNFWIVYGVESDKNYFNRALFEKEYGINTDI